MATIVAFDLSLTSTGVADRDGTRRICPKSTGVERLVEIRDAVIRTCYRHILKHDLVVIEGYSYASGNKAHDIGELGGVVRLALHEAGIRYEVVPPASLKLYACGVGNASKDDVLLAAVRRLGYEGKSKDEADAYWLYALAMHALGEPIVDVPKAHLRALKALPWAVAVAA
jgi:crossover junction endodeoxyribonuclease RuvC